MKLGILGFSGSLIAILISVLQNYSPSQHNPELTTWTWGATSSFCFFFILSFFVFFFFIFHFLSLALLCLEVAATEWTVQSRVFSWILQFWHQIYNQRPQKPPYTKFHSNCKKLRIRTNITAVLNPPFWIFQFWHNILNQWPEKHFFFYDLIIDHKYGTLHALMPKIRQES